MATTLEQVMAELNPYYAGSEGLLNKQLSALPAQGEAEISGLDAKLQRANSNILDSARSRGLGFSGIPIAEQAEYAATDYAPAVARVKQGQESSRVGILESLNSLGRDKRSQAQSIFDTSEQRRLQQEAAAEARRQFEEGLRFQREQLAQQARLSGGGGGGSAGDYLSQLLSAGEQKPTGPTKQDVYAFNEAKRIGSLFKNNPAAFTKHLSVHVKNAQEGNQTARNLVLAAYKNIGHANAPALKKWGLI